MYTDHWRLTADHSMPFPRIDTLLPALQCPDCHASSFSFKNLNEAAEKPFPDGEFVCGNCSSAFRLEDGIADFLPKAAPSLTFAQQTGQWDVTATAYERVWRKRALGLLAGERFPPEREIGLLLDALAPTFDTGEPALWLDLACSTSFYGRPIAKKIKESNRAESLVVGVDLSRRMLEEARAYAREEGVADAMLWIRADAERLPFRDGSINGIACGGSLNEYRSAENVLREGKRVLTPGSGRYFVMNQLDPPFIIRSALSFLGGLTFFTRVELDRIFEKAGLTALSRLDVGKIAITTLTA
jgi:SAM-dependent methyltransferase/uncharacterized protein YbaR (Trm112 family)